MSGGIAIFLLLVIIVVGVGIFMASSGVGAGLWNRETKRDKAAEEDPEAQQRFDRGERPEHTRVDEQGNQTYIGS